MAEARIVNKSERTLSRGIRSWHVSLIALGGIIGSCYFLGLGLTFHDMGAGAVLISYALAGLTIYGVMQSFAELLVNIPRRGSFVSYTREFMGDTASAGIGWAFWANWVCYIPSEALAVATFANALFHEGQASLTMIFIYGVISLALLTLINIYHVTWFGHLESIMAIIKIIAVALFVIAAIVIWMGVWNHGAVMSNEDGETFTIGAGFIGLKAMLGTAGGAVVDTAHQLFPGGGFIIITMMIWTLVNFQGSEIVGLSAAETQDPEKNVPAACKKVAFRIILIYLVPIFVLSLIMPYFAATLEDSVFAQALVSYGFGWGAKLFEVVTLIAAFSCANSGFYGTVRSLYGLSVEGLAPKFLSDLNRFNTPQKATIFSLAFVWIIFVFSFLIVNVGWGGGENNKLYIALIGIAGFTGTLCWVGILYSQIVFRKRLKRRGYDWRKDLTVKAKWFPGLAWFAVIVQAAAMILLIFEEGDGIPIFVLSMDIIIVPIVVYALQKYRGKIRTTVTLGSDEVTFDEKFPDKTGEDTKAAVEPTVGGGGTLSALLVIVTVVSVALSFVTIHFNPAELERGNIFTGEGMGIVWLLILALFITYAIVVVCVRSLIRKRAAAPADDKPAGSAGAE
ncbi:MAG: amino acid permease [Clostridiales Family XIII bacterium]|jgi:AAT family amino acid transporter|nr:amino acid permease [Clostridiales Family XIII bacterium]